MDLINGIWVDGIAAPQGSKKHVGNGRMVESSKKLKPWRALVAKRVSEELLDPPLDGPVKVSLAFVMPRPVSTPKTRPTPPAIKRPDVDKLSRAILDAITGIWFLDDSQVVDLHATKRIAELNEQPGVWVKAVDGSA